MLGDGALGGGALGERALGEGALGEGDLGEAALGEPTLGEATLGGTNGGVFGCSSGVGGLKVTLCCSLSKSPKIFSTLLGSLNSGMNELVSPRFSFPSPFFFSFVFFLSEPCNMINNEI